MRSIRIWWQNNRFMLGATLASAAAVLSLGYLVVESGHLDEHRRFAAVRLGMTQDEVVAVLGMPPGQYGRPGTLYTRPPIFT